jgi:hypothetical protein
MEILINLNVLFYIFYLILMIVCSTLLCVILMFLVKLKSIQKESIKYIENSLKQTEKKTNDDFIMVKRSLIEQKETQMFKEQLIDEISKKFQKEIDDLKKQHENKNPMINEAKIENLDEKIISDLSKKWRKEINNFKEQKKKIEDELIIEEINDNSSSIKIDQKKTINDSEQQITNLTQSMQQFKGQNKKLIKETNLAYPTESQNKFAFKIFKYFSEKNKGFI